MRGPRRLGRFRCEKLTAGDEVLETWQARVQGLAGFDRFFTITCLRAEVAATHPALVARFLNAGRRASALNDERIARVIETGTGEATAYVAAEFVHGVDVAGLRDRASEAQDDDPGDRKWFQLVAHIGAEAAQALASAHGASPPVVHGGLSPSEILATVRGSLKVLAFGIRAAVGGGSAKADRWRYRAPELASPSASPTPEGDLFALGLALLELAAKAPLPSVEDQTHALATIPGALSMVIESLIGEAQSRPTAEGAAEAFRRAYGGADRESLTRELGALIARLTARREGSVVTPPPARPGTPAPIASEKTTQDKATQDKATKGEPPVAGAVPAPERPPTPVSDFSAFAEETRRTESPPFREPPTKAEGGPPAETARAGAEKDRPSPSPPPLLAETPAQPPAIVARPALPSPPARLGLLLVATALTSAVVAGAGGFYLGSQQARRPRPSASAVRPTAPSPPAPTRPAIAARPVVPPPAPRDPTPSPAPPQPTPEAPSAKIPAPPAEAPANTGSQAVTAPSLTELAVEILSQPSGAMVWLDGQESGRTPMTARLRAGAPVRLVLVSAGHQTFKVSFDPGQRQRVEESLTRISAPSRGEIGVRVDCETVDRYPVVIDDRETGLLCPTSRITLDPGVHRVGLYIPETDALVSREVTVSTGIRSVKLRK